MSLSKLSQLPRQRLWHADTPIEELPNMASELVAAKLWVKRDDCNGLAFGGNKVRQMEYYLGEAIAQDCDTLLITGAVQSNFVRTAAAACAKHGLQCHVQLENRVAKTSYAYASSGNVLLNSLLGATLHYYPSGEDEEGADQNLEKLASAIRAKGQRPYVVHLHPSHPPLGALGYVDCALELDRQLTKLAIEPDVIFVPSGSGNTHGGFLYGWRAIGRKTQVIGSCVRRSADAQKPRLIERLQQIGELLDEPPVAAASDIHLTDGFLAPGYGQAGEEVKQAISLAAGKEALILDPVYTAKTFAAAFEHARQNPSDKILILHTGGGPSVFGYSLEDMLPSTL